MPGRICFPENVVYSGLLHWLHNNYSYLKICLQDAQLTNCYIKLNTNNPFSYGLREVNQIIQKKNKIRTLWDWFIVEKVRALSLESIFLALINKKRLNALFCLFYLFMYRFINIFSTVISEDVLFVSSCKIQCIIVTLWHLKLTVWIWLHT